MDAVREVVSGNALAKIIRLPKWLHDRQVEVIVFPVQNRANDSIESDIPRISRKALDEMKKVSSAVELTGAIPLSHMTVTEIREERLTDRYGSVD